MLSPKEKAKALVGMYLETAIGFNAAKECALICVRQIINANNENLGEYNLLSDNDYWVKVETEINKI